MKATAAFFCLAFSILLSVVSIGLATWLAIWSFGAPPRSNGNSNSNGSSKGGNSISNNNWTFRRIHGGANIAWAVYELGWLVLYLLPSTRAALAAARRRHHQRDENGNNEGEKNRAELAVSPSVEQLRRVGRRHGGIVWSIGLLITVVRIYHEHLKNLLAAGLFIVKAAPSLRQQQYLAKDGRWSLAIEICGRGWSQE